jgi:acetate kinase
MRATCLSNVEFHRRETTRLSFSSRAQTFGTTFDTDLDVVSNGSRPMKILALNCGSSSLKADVLDTHDDTPLASLVVERLGDDGSTRATGPDSDSPRSLDISTHAEALDWALSTLRDHLPEALELDGVGHRVVHGGESFDHPVRIDDEVEARIEELADLAPLHNPANLE